MCLMRKYLNFKCQSNRRELHKNGVTGSSHPYNWKLGKQSFGAFIYIVSGKSCKQLKNDNVKRAVNRINNYKLTYQLLICF